MDVVEMQHKQPINAWAKDEYYKEIGSWTLASADMVLEGMTLAPLTRFLGWSADEARALCAKVRKDYRNRNIHGYWAT